MLRSHPAVFIAVDVLWRDGVSLLTLPLVERRAVLGQLAAASAGTLRLGTSLAVKSADEIDAAFAAARSRRNEGLVLKDPASEYVPGRRGGAWLKLKTHLPTLDCVVVAAEYGHGKRRGTLSDYTFAVWRGDPDAAGELVTIGKAYSGVTDAEIAELTTLFKSIATRDDGRVFVVEPRVVMEIAFDTIQPSDRHSSGYALRFPRIKRIRTDKLPRDADRLERVVEIYRGESNLGRRDDPAPPEPTLFDHL
jgi:DNA ligase-1